MYHQTPDETDRKILRLLSENGRISYSELGARLGISRTAVRKRIAALESAGMISGYYARIILPPEKERNSDTETEKTVRLKTYLLHFVIESARLEQIAAALQEQQYVVWTAELAGKENMAALIRAEDRQRLREKLRSFAAEVPGILRLRAQEILRAQTDVEPAEYTEQKERADEQRKTDYGND